jgi:hypothetical protein
MSIAMSIAVRSPISPPTGFCYKKPCVVKDVVKDTVKAPNLRVLAAAADRFKKCGRVIKKKTTLFPTEVVYELYPPKRKRERWFCQFINYIDDKTFLGFWFVANSQTILDKKNFPEPTVFEWRTVKKRML